MTPSRSDLPESQALTSLDRRPAKKPRACVHCHMRKVRCNAWEVGIPCTRCKRRHQADTCVLTAVPNISTTSTTTNAKPVAGNAVKRQRVSTSSDQDDLDSGWGHPGYESFGTSTGDHFEATMFDHSAPFTSNQSPRTDTNGTESIVSQSPTMLPPHPPTHQQQQLHSEDTQPQNQPRPFSSHEPQRQSQPQQQAPPAPQQQSKHHQVSPAVNISSESPTNPATREEDVPFRICEEMSRDRPSVVSPSSQVHSDDRREVIEYHEGINSITILGEVLGQKRPNRLVRIVVMDEGTQLNRQAFPGLDETDMEYLHAKGALSFPPRPVCDELLRLYFSCIYPYAPILDRVKFMREYSANKHSPFLMQSILANAVPYAPAELLAKAGYKDRLAAQKTLFSRARLLYDMGCEKSQLCVMQGSIMLSSLSFSYALDKDYRFWLTNATRIASQMGLHRNYVFQGLDLRSKSLFRRIWWTLNIRDTLLAISGSDNLRRFNERYCDTDLLTEADWDHETHVPDCFAHILPPVTRVQKVYLVDYCKLTVISANFIHDFKTPGHMPTTEEIDNLSAQITAWKQQLAPEMQIGLYQEWSAENVWVLLLQAIGFRLEAVFARAVKEFYRAKNDVASMHRIAVRQESAMFELSTIIQRASVHDVLRLCPLSFMIGASTILAMRIEMALDPSVSPRRQMSNKSQIFTELEYLREGCEYWSSLIWTVRMFEAVLVRTRLSLTVSASTPHETRARDGDGDADSAPPTAATATTENTSSVDSTGVGGHRHRNEYEPMTVNGGPQMDTHGHTNAPAKAHNLAITAGAGTTGRAMHGLMGTGQPTQQWADQDAGMMNGNSFALTTTADLSMAMSDEVFGILPVTDSYDWLQGLFGPREDDFSEFFSHVL